LIQLSTRSADYIIDPLRIADMQPLAPLLADPAVEKVFHAAEYDMMTMKRDFGFTFENLFDTVIAARICGYKQIGLGNLLGEFFGVEMDKRHQRDDWGQRPLPADSLLYAQTDTHYLPALRDLLSEELTRLKRWEEAREAFREACYVPPARAAEFDPEGYWRIALPLHLPRRTVAILRELYLLRESIARQRDVPPFKVMSDKTLALMAEAAPRNLLDLTSMNGVGASLVRRFGRDILAAVERGEQGKPPAPPRPEPSADPEVVERYTALREWRKHRALERGVESDVIISRDALWELARRAPKSLEAMRDVPGLGPWRLETYGVELLEVITRYP
jgi:ribonuclease D